MSQKRHRASVIRIINPIPGGKRYTTQKSAQRLIQRGVAVEKEGQLLILPPAHAICAVGRTSLAHERLRMADDKMIAQRKGGQVYWNGADLRDGAMHPPFCNVQFPRVAA